MAGSKHGRGSEQVSLRLPDGLRERIKTYAERQGRSMNAEIVLLLEREFPEPESIDQRLEGILRLVGVLKDEVTDSAVNDLSAEILDVVQGIASGRVRGLDPAIRDRLRQRYEEWQQHEAENRRDRFELDHEEALSYIRGDGTSKYNDLDDEGEK